MAKETWYSINRYDIAVTAKEFLGSTEYYLLEPNNRREKKVSTYRYWFSTFDEAKLKIIERTERAIQSHNEQANRAKADLAKAKALTGPTSN